MFVPLILVVAGAVPTPRVLTLESVVSQLCQDLHKRISVEPRLGKKLVFISDPGSQPEPLLSSLATTVHASLVTTANGLRLQRTSGDLRTARKAEIAQRAGWIRARLDQVAKFRADRLSRGSFEAAYARELDAEARARENYHLGRGLAPAAFFVNQLLPGEILIESLIRRIGVDQLATVPTGESQVYEDFPADSAFPLPDHADIVDQYVADSLPLERMSLPGQSTSPYLSHLGGPTRTPVKLRLRQLVERTRVIFNLEGFDSRGTRVLAADFFTQSKDPSRLPASIAREAMQKQDAVWETLSASAQGALGWFSPTASVTSDNVPDWFLHPESGEPLNLFVAEALNGLASLEQSKPVMVDVDDAFWDAARLCCLKGRFCATGFRDILSESENYDRTETGWGVIWRPKNPELVEASLADRKVLGRAARALVFEQSDPLKPLSRLFYDASKSSSTLAWTWARKAVLFDAPDNGSLFDESAYRMLGALPASVWNELENGKTVSAGQAENTDDVRNLLSGERYQTTGQGNLSDLKRHALELYSEHSVASTLISLHPMQSTVIRFWNQTAVEPKWWNPADVLFSMAGVRMEYLASGEPTPTGTFFVVSTQAEFEEKLGKSRKFRLAVEHDTVITLGLPEGRRIELRHRGAFTDLHPAGDYADLPAEFRDEVWNNARTRQLAERNATLSNSMIGQQSTGAGARRINP
jgi:hypothetical protein